MRDVDPQLGRYRLLAVLFLGMVVLGLAGGARTYLQQTFDTRWALSTWEGIDIARSTVLVSEDETERGVSGVYVLMAETTDSDATLRRIASAEGSDAALDSARAIEAAVLPDPIHRTLTPDARCTELSREEDGSVVLGCTTPDERTYTLLSTTR